MDAQESRFWGNEFTSFMNQSRTAVQTEDVRNIKGNQAAWPCSQFRSCPEHHISIEFNKLGPPSA